MQRESSLPTICGVGRMTSYFLRTLFVKTEGTRLILEGDAIKALKEGEEPKRLPLNAIDSLIVLAGIDVSTPLLIRCAEDGRTVAFLSRFGKPRAIVEGPFSGRGQLRSLQYQRQLDGGNRSEVACTIVAGKARQMNWGLRQWARDAEPSVAQILRHLAEQIDTDSEKLAGASRQSALGIEGIASKRYFQGLALAVRHQEFSGRVRRPPTDIVNAVLSTLYGLTRISVHGAIHAAGLDPFCGFLHGDRDGQPSLVLDLMEEFRPVADHLGVSLLNRRQLREDHFSREVSGAVVLNEKGMEIVFDAWHRHRNEEVDLAGFEESVCHASIPIIQANVLANALRSGKSYHPHRMKVQ